MKKIAAMTAIVALVPMPVLAVEQGGFTGPSSTTQVSSTAQAGGLIGPSGAVTTVANAKSLRDDTWVTLRGKTTERVSNNLYKSQDTPGVINVDIDHKRRNGATVDPQDTVEIQREVDKDRNSVEIDVKQIHKVAP